MLCVCVLCEFRFGAMLLVFFFTSSRLTKFGDDKKRKIDPEYKEGGQRNWYVYVYVAHLDIHSNYGSTSDLDTVLLFVLLYFAYMPN